MVTKGSAGQRPKVQNAGWLLPRILRRRRLGFCKPLPPIGLVDIMIAKRFGTSGVGIPSQADTSEGLVVAEEAIWEAVEEFHADDLDKMEMGGTFDKHMWLKAAKEFESDFKEMQMQMHRFPAILRGLGSSYIVPKVVAIGPYHRGLDHLKEMEKVKQVAAYQFISLCGTTYDEIHDTILNDGGNHRSLYDKDAVAAIGDAEFVDMMILDGIFLLQYMIMTLKPKDLFSSLLRCFHSNQACISNDIMLLENQLPWAVIEILNNFSYSPVKLEDFVAKMGRTLQARGDKNTERFRFSAYEPPHLLGLLRFYKIGGNTRGLWKAYPDDIQPMSKTISVIELAELGIKLTASKTTKLMDMGIKKRPLFSQIFVAPLLLDEIRACWLINMVALEICIATDFRCDATATPVEITEKSADCCDNVWDTAEMPVVCSYLAFLAMLMDREEDVHELRSKRLVQGELTNKEMLNFFKCLIKHITGGPLYMEILGEIEDYRMKWWMLIKVHAFFYKNYKIIAAMLSIIGVLVGIFKALLSLKEHGTSGGARLYD